MHGGRRGILPVVAVIVLAVTALAVSLILGYAPAYFIGLVFILLGLWIAVLLPSVHGATIGASMEILGFVFCLIPAVLSFSAATFGALI